MTHSYMFEFDTVPIYDLQQGLHHPAGDQGVAAGLVAGQVVQEREERRGERQRELLLEVAGHLRPDAHVAQQLDVVLAVVRLAQHVYGRQAVGGRRVGRIGAVRLGLLRQGRDAVAHQHRQEAVVLVRARHVYYAVQAGAGFP